MIETALDQVLRWRQQGVDLPISVNPDRSWRPGDRQGVIGLAHAFGRDVIAEGVETRAHGELLRSLGCMRLQGYGIAKPMPAESLPKVCRKSAESLPKVCRKSAESLPNWMAEWRAGWRCGSGATALWLVTVQQFNPSAPSCGWHQPAIGLVGLSGGRSGRWSVAGPH